MDDLTYHRLRRACDDNDFTTLRQAGWLTVYERLSTWFKRRVTLQDFGPYLELVRDFDPSVVEQAMTEHAEASEWTPKPADLRRLAAGATKRASERAAIDGAQRDTPRPDQTPRVFAHLARLVRQQGQKPCECKVRPTNWWCERLDGTRLTVGELAARSRESTRRTKLPEHVIRCPTCQGLELGQLLQASVWWEQEGKHAAS